MNPAGEWSGRKGLSVTYYAITRASVKKVNELPSRRPGIAEAVNGALGLRSGRKMVSTSLHINDGRRIMLPTVAARLLEA